MSLQFSILGSSSSGNAALLDTGKTKILIDAGFSCKKILGMLEAVGVSIHEISGVFITHEHSDHAAGLVGLSKFGHLKVFANQETADTIQPRLKRPVSWQIFETGQAFSFEDLTVESFSTPHDAYDPVGYVFRTDHVDPAPEACHSLAWATDLGHIPERIKKIIAGVDILVLEANYDPELLEEDTLRPFSVKQRIRGRHGHLSNQDAFECVQSIENPQWKHLFLAHLSQHCNRLDIVEKVFKPLQTASAQFSINIVDPMGHTAPIVELIH